MILGISAVRNSSGGAIAHLKGILEYNPITNNPRIEKIVLFTNTKVATSLSVGKNIKVIDVTKDGNSLFKTIWFEVFQLSKKAKSYNVNAMLYTDASAIVTTRPSYVMSRDMLSFEPGIISLYRGKKYIRLLIIGLLQRYNLRKANVAIFLTEYAKQIIAPSSSGVIIPHGIEQSWRGFWKSSFSKAIRILYVSNAAPYKGHMELIKAIEILNKQGKKILLTCVGGASGAETTKIRKYITSQNLDHIVKLLPLKQRAEIIENYLENDIFIFASKCENMPNTLVEAVLSGIPVISSNNGPMRALIGNYKYTFNANSILEIVKAIDDYLEDSNAIRNKEYKYLLNRFEDFTWENSSKKLAKVLTEN